MAKHVSCKVCNKKTRRPSGVCTACAAAKPCDRCGCPRGNAEHRFCKECVKAVKIELEGNEYLQDVPKKIGPYRGIEQKEDIHSTKFGRD